jgi:hypothetical protein
VTVRAGPGDAHRGAGLDEGLAFQDRLDGVDGRSGQRGQVREGFLADLAVGLAERAAQPTKLRPRPCYRREQGLRRAARKPQVTTTSR